MSEYIQKAIKNLEYKNKIVNTMELKFGYAYYQAAQKVFGVDLSKPGQVIDNKQLESLEKQRMMSKEIAAYLRKIAADELGVDMAKLGKGPEADFKGEQILQTYWNLTEQAIHRIIKERGSRYTFNEHMNIGEQVKRGIDQSLRGIATQHLGIEHLDDIINQIGTEVQGDGYFDKTKGLDIEEARNLLELYVSNDMSLPKLFLKNKEYFVDKSKAKAKEPAKKAAA